METKELGEKRKTEPEFHKGRILEMWQQQKQNNATKLD